MPAWGVEFGGSMTPLMIDDVIHYIESIQVGAPEISDTCKKPTESLYEQCGQEIFEARCAVCHGPEAQGKEAEGTTDDPWHQGMALWKGDVSHLPENLHLLTVINGRRFAFMPQFGEAPVQGVPVPLYPLTQEQSSPTSGACSGHRYRHRCRRDDRRGDGLLRERVAPAFARARSITRLLRHRFDHDGIHLDPRSCLVA
jgi:hypothetical protein